MPMTYSKGKSSFKNRKELRKFISDKLAPIALNFTEHYRVTIFEYHGPMKNLAQMLEPEINMRFKGKNRKLGFNTGDAEMIWTDGYFTIEAQPMGEKSFMVIMTSRIEDSYPMK